MNIDQFENLTRHVSSWGGSRPLPRLGGLASQTRTMLLAALIAAAALLPHAPFVEARVVQGGQCAANDAAFLLGSEAYSQSFTATHTGKLISAVIETYNYQNAPATYTVQLWDAASGLPTGTGPLASTTVVQPGLHEGVETPVFATPPMVRAGHTYALVVGVPDPNDNGVMVVSNVASCDTFALSNSGPFVVDTNSQDMRFAVNVKLRRHRHRH